MHCLLLALCMLLHASPLPTSCLSAALQTRILGAGSHRELLPASQLHGSSANPVQPSSRGCCLLTEPPATLMPAATWRSGTWTAATARPSLLARAPMWALGATC